MNNRLLQERTITVGFFGVLVVGSLVSWWYLVSSQTNVSVGCLPTQPDAQGPYYQEEAPKRQNIAPKASGEKLVVRGRVIAGCNQLVAGAKLEVWQADSQGKYNQAWFRGTMYTDEGGNYEVETVMPGAYTQGWGVTRPAHIHFKVTLPDGRQLTSQMYFDSGGGVDPSRLVSLEKTPEGLRGSFDIVFGG